MTWDRKLARALDLADGTRLRTLREAADWLIEHYDRPVTDNPNNKRDLGIMTVTHARDLLITAAASGRREDIALATDQVERVLMRRR